MRLYQKERQRGQATEVSVETAMRAILIAPNFLYRFTESERSARPYMLEGREIVVSGQVQLDGEFYGLRTPLGVPIVVTPNGWSQVVPLQLWAEEADLLQTVAMQLNRRLKEDLDRG